MPEVPGKCITATVLKHSPHSLSILTKPRPQTVGTMNCHQQLDVILHYDTSVNFPQDRQTANKLYIGCLP